MEQLEGLHLQLFDQIETENFGCGPTIAASRACRVPPENESFRWLEIGSHLGGSLQALVRDPACTHIDSIDPRPAWQEDERLQIFPYPENSTARMLELLGRLPDADLAKLNTHEATTEQVDPESLPPAQVCFIDGEHTDTACSRDADFCRRVVREQGLILFHDVWIVYRGVTSFIERLARESVAHSLAYLPDSIFAVELGDRRLLEDAAVVSRHLDAGAGVLWMLNSNHSYRALLKGRRARLLRRLRVLPPP